MENPSSDAGRSLLELTPDERDERGITAVDVREALLAVIAEESSATVFEGCSFPRLDVEYLDLGGETKHPLVFRDCSFDGIDASHAAVECPVRFEGCTIAGATFDHARFEYDVAVIDSTVTASMSAFETRFARGADFTETTFEAALNCNEASFGDEATFRDARFEAPVTFRAAGFSGRSNEFEDHASFERVEFAHRADFRQADFRFTTFYDGTFHDRALFEETRFGGDADFASVTFHEEAVFDEADFAKDTTFESVTFHSKVGFRGAEFEGGARTLQDDVSFVDAVFCTGANFRGAWFRSVNAARATFEGHAMFENAWFDDAVAFTAVTFDGEADFDEARFSGNADFTDACFLQTAVFRGAVFDGGTNYHKANAVFERVRFDDDVDFDNASFTSANFRHTRFGGVIDFSGATFDDEIDFLAESIGNDTHVDLTRAVIKSGTITQPKDGWIGYDLTRASIGDLTLETTAQSDHPELLNYFRFCNTEFNEFDGYYFDFTAHARSLTRSNWTLHEFEGSTEDYEYELELTPATIETTYLKAKTAASQAGYIKAAGEFRIKRQQYARKKHLAIAHADTANLRTRFKALSRAVESYFLDITCGYGMRLARIIGVFLVTPLFPALLYAFGGAPLRTSADQLSSLHQLTTPQGLAILYDNIHFSYITFLTIGYGGIAPEGALARLFAGLEVYLSVVLGGLVLYAFIKRSEL